MFRIKLIERFLIQFCLVFIIGLTTSFAQHGWPIAPSNSEHPIGNSFGEFQDFGGVYQHTGIDILGTPQFTSSGAQDPSAPWILVTVSGTVNQLSDIASTLYNGTTIQGTNGVDYRYWHLQNGSYDPTYVNNFNNGTNVAAGDQIARVVRWTCDYHHLHYDLESGTNYLDPLADITPNPDPDTPEIDAIEFAQDNSNPWIQLNPASPGGCTVVSGQVDIIVKLRDQDNAGSTLAGANTLWVHNLRWRACPETNPNCTWQDTHAFNNMPTAWGTQGNASSAAYFSNRTPWDSDSNYCATTWIYGVVTNFVGGAPNANGNWDTTTVADGSYTISVEATDFAGNVTTYSTRVCVQNGLGCVTEMTIRDAEDDSGAIPYPGDVWWSSPDITANPGTADEDHNINVGMANPIEVRVWNYGGCDIAGGTTYEVGLGWGKPAALLPESQVIGRITETVPAGGWPIGASRVTTFTWTPSSDDVPLGHNCLVAWVDTQQDGIANTTSINWDDNQAQQNITFQNAAPSGIPHYSSFWIHPQKEIEKRSIELIFHHSGKKSVIKDARLHISPGLIVKRVIGGHVLGGYKGEKPIDPCAQDRRGLCNDICLSWDKAAKMGCTLVIGGIDPYGRLLLEGISVKKPVRLILEIFSEKEIGKGQFSDVDIVEYGILPGHQNIGPIGGLTLRFEY